MDNFTKAYLVIICAGGGIALCGFGFALLTWILEKITGKKDEEPLGGAP